MLLLYYYSRVASQYALFLNFLFFAYPADCLRRSADKIARARS